MADRDRPTSELCGGGLHNFVANSAIVGVTRCQCGLVVFGGIDLKEVFHTGALRSATTVGADKPTDYSQFSHVAARLHAETQAEGNAKYGYGNWQKGIPLSNLLSHCLAHIYAIMNGDVSENHFGHAIWNLDKAAHFVEVRPELVDIEPLKRSMGLGGEKPADPNTLRNTNCFFCSAPLVGPQFKVIPPHNIYRQAHTACFVSATKEQLEEFDTPPEGKAAKV